MLRLICGERERERERERKWITHLNLGWIQNGGKLQTVTVT